MKCFSALLLCLFCILSASCGKAKDSEMKDVNITGQFLRISDKLCVILLDEESRERYPNDVYMRLLTDHAFIDPDDRVSLDGFSDGDRISVACTTIADLSPRVIDVTSAELLEEGDISDVDTAALLDEMDDGDLSDVEIAFYDWLEMQQ